MGRATRWFKGIFGIKAQTQTQNDPTFTPSNSGRRKMPTSGDSAMHSGRLCNNPTTIPPNITAAEAAWLKSYYSEASQEQSKRAIAVAAATAAAADAAVAAAHAAVAVVRLTSRGRTSMLAAGCGAGGDGGMEKWAAAIKIQTAFRGYLARKALRALKGLVKIQALVRGILVRKQAKATLHGIQALIRAQATVRSKRGHAHTANYSAYYHHHPQILRARRSMEIFDGRSEQEASIHNRRLSASFESRTISPIIEDIPKIVEVDPGRSGSWDHDPFYPPRLSIPSFQHYRPNTDQWGLTGHESRFSTAHSTPRFMNSGGQYPDPGTPCRSVCGDSNYLSRHNGNYHNAHPNYMAKTQSFWAKVRSQSAPKQRPETGPKKKVSLNEVIESRNSLSGVRMQSTCSQVQEAIKFKNVVMGKLERSHGLAREPQRHHLCKN